MWAFAFLLLPVPAAFPQTIDSLMGVVHHSHVDSVRLDALLSLSSAWRASNPDTAMFYADQALFLAQKIKDPAAIGSSLSRQGVILKRQGLQDSAVSVYQRAIHYKRVAGDSLGVAMLQTNIGAAYKGAGRFEAALTWTLKGVEGAERLDHTSLLANTYNNLASLWVILEDSVMAEQYYRKSLELHTRLQDPAGSARTQFNLGLLDFERGKYREALVLLKKSLVYYKETENLVFMARIYNSLGAVNAALDAPKEAIAFYEKAMALYIRTDNVHGKATLYNNMASVYGDQALYRKSLMYYRKAATSMASLDLPHELCDIYWNMSYTFEDLGVPDSAFYYFQRHSELKDQLLNEEKHKQIAEMREKYESAQKDRSIADLLYEKSIQESEIKLQESEIKLRNLFAGAAGVLLLISLFWGINYRQKLRVERALVAKESELHRQQMMDMLKDQELQTMNAYYNGELAERDRVARELHDRIGSQLAAVMLHFDYVSNAIEDHQVRTKMEHAGALFKQTCQDVRKVAHDFSDSSGHKFELLPAIEDLCQTISSSGRLAVELDISRQKATFQDLPSSVKITLFRALQELLSNSIRHAEATTVSVLLIQRNDHVCLEVRDNGKGMRTDKASSANGMGLKKIKQSIESLDGKFELAARPGRGTAVILKYPISEPAGQPSPKVVYDTKLS